MIEACDCGKIGRGNPCRDCRKAARPDPSQPDDADDLGLDREARWQPDGAELVERLDIEADAADRDDFVGTASLLREAAAALTAAQDQIKLLRARGDEWRIKEDAAQERVAALEAALKCEHDWTTTERNGKTWWKCRDCRLLELWEGGLLVDIALSPQPAEELREEPPC